MVLHKPPEWLKKHKTKQRNVAEDVEKQETSLTEDRNVNDAATLENSLAV